MATLNTAWSISRSAITADQAALVTVSNNTANATTPGYTEEAAVWQQAAPISTSRGLIGDGVLNTGAASQRDLVLNRSLDLQTQQQAATQARLGALQALQATFSSATEVTSSANSSSSASGVSGGLSQFFGSLQQLEASPSDASIRQSVLSAATNLISTFNTASSTLEQQQQSLSGEVANVVTQANGLLKSLAALNTQIQSQDPHTDAGVLEDQRQQDLTSLSQLLGVHQITTEKNGLTITTADGIPLVEGGVSFALTMGSLNGAPQVLEGSNNLTSSFIMGGGQVGGLLEVANTDIPSALSSIDTLAFSVGSQANTVNEGGLDLNENPGGPIFTLPSSAPGSAGSITVAISDPSLIAAAAVGAGILDGTQAAALSALATSQIVNGQTPSNYYAQFVSSLGSTVSEVQSTNTAQQSSLAQITNQQTAISGVSLNTEATALENMEQAYQAASKVFTIIDKLVSASINLGVETAVS